MQLLVLNMKTQNEIVIKSFPKYQIYLIWFTTKMGYETISVSYPFAVLPTYRINLYVYLIILVRRIN